MKLRVVNCLTNPSLATAVTDFMGIISIKASHLMIYSCNNSLLFSSSPSDNGARRCHGMLGRKVLDVSVATKALQCQAGLASLLEAVPGLGTLVLLPCKDGGRLSCCSRGTVSLSSAPPLPPLLVPHRPWETYKTLLYCPDIWCLHLFPFIIWQIFYKWC